MRRRPSALLISPKVPRQHLGANSFFARQPRPVKEFRATRAFALLGPITAGLAKRLPSGAKKEPRRFP